MALMAKTVSLLKFGESNFDDETWLLKKKTPGQVKPNAIIDWSKPLRNGESLCAPQHHALLLSLKCFVWSLVYKPQESAASSAGGIAGLVTPMRDFACFLIDQGIQELDEITVADSWVFAEEVTDFYGADYSKSEQGKVFREPSHSRVLRAVSIPTLIYRQRRSIEELGGKALMFEPYDGSKPFRVVSKDLGIERGPGMIPPIPDQVAIPILNTAVQMMDESADALIAVTNEFLEIRGLAADWEKLRPVDLVNAYARLSECAKGISIPVPDGDDGQIQLDQPVKKMDADGEEFVLSSPTEVLRYLLVSCVAACSIVLQAGTGLRTHELLSLQALPLQKNGWPACLSKKVSLDNMTELFYVQAVTSKRGNPRTVDWLVGASPAGSDYVPPTVRAILTVSRLLAVFRELGKASELFVVMKTNGGLPMAERAVSNMTNGYLSRFQRAFVLNWVDLSTLTYSDHESYKRGKIRPHQWRPTFATFVFRTNPRMLKALSEHFKHVNDSVTSKYYIGNDPAFLAACDDAQTMAAVQALRAITFKGASVAGGFARYVDKFRAEIINHLVDDKSIFDEQAAIRYIKEEEVEIWNTAYGQCWASQLPSKSLCNQRAGISTLGSTSPNLAIAHIDLCIGCSCLEINADHKEFWLKRLDQNTEIEKEAARLGDATTGTIAQKRRKQAESILRHLGA